MKNNNIQETFRMNTQSPFVPTHASRMRTPGRTWFLSVGDWMEQSLVDHFEWIKIINQKLYLMLIQDSSNPS
jgi:hypothetical protein